MGTRPVIKIFGERNTGTNYLQQLMILNFDAVYLRGEVPRIVNRLARSFELPRDLYFRLTFRKNLGWKHSSGPDAAVLTGLTGPLNVGFITCTKNPYAWLLSMYRRPYHYQGAKGTFADFLSRPWATVGRENHPTAYDTPIAMWNDKNRSYLRLGEHVRCINLRYEELLVDPESTLGAVASRFQLARQAGSFINIEGSTKNDAATFNGYREYYLTELWKNKLDMSVIGIINRHLDQDLVRRMGYTVLDRV